MVITSRRLIALGALVQFVPTSRLLIHLSRPESFRLPRVIGLSPEPPLVAAVLGMWAIGAVGLVWARGVTRVGWLLPLAAASAMMLDQQVSGGHLYLLALLPWFFILHEIVERSDDLRRLAGVPLRVVQAQISIVMAWAAIGKMNLAFLSGGVLRASLYGIVPFPEQLRVQSVLSPMAVVVILVEAYVALGLWIPRHRRVALGMAVLLHVSIALLLYPPLPLLVFGLVMGSGYVLFAAEPWGEREGRVVRRTPRGRPSR